MSLNPFFVANTLDVTSCVFHPGVGDVENKKCLITSLTLGLILTAGLALGLWHLFTSDSGGQHLAVIPAQPEDNLDTALYQLKKDAWAQMPSDNHGTASNIDYAYRYKSFLRHYEDTRGIEDCSNGVPRSVEVGQASCRFEPHVLGDCSVAPYGYELRDQEIEDRGAKIKPCFIVKLEPVEDWVPRLARNTKNLSDVMPQRVKSLIRNDDSKVSTNF